MRHIGHRVALGDERKSKMHDHSQEVDDMTPSRELDMEVATMALAWADLSRELGQDYMVLPQIPGGGPARPVPHFSTDDADAQQIVETMTDSGPHGSPYRIAVHSPNRHPPESDRSNADQWYVIFSRYDDYEDCTNVSAAYGQTKAEAISKAALKAAWDAD
jgi:hypothetical protein